jgi:reactive intermediate/imine deaminase
VKKGLALFASVQLVSAQQFGSLRPHSVALRLDKSNFAVIEKAQATFLLNRCHEHLIHVDDRCVLYRLYPEHTPFPSEQPGSGRKEKSQLSPFIALKKWTEYVQNNANLSNRLPLGAMPMKIKEITIEPDPYKPFRLAQGYRVGELLFISGQAAIDRNGQIVGIGDFDAQAEQVFANLERVLHAGSSSLANVIKVTIFLRDMSNFAKIVELRGRYFRPPYPADTIVEVASLYSPEALIEIEAIAVADEAVERT